MSKNKKYTCSCGLPIKVKAKDIREVNKIICKNCGKRLPKYQEDKIRKEFIIENKERKF